MFTTIFAKDSRARWIRIHCDCLLYLALPYVNVFRCHRYVCFCADLEYSSSKHFHEQNLSSGLVNIWVYSNASGTYNTPIIAHIYFYSGYILCRDICLGYILFLQNACDSWFKVIDQPWYITSNVYSNAFSLMCLRFIQM